MSKQLRTIAFTLVFVLLAVLTAAVLTNDTKGIKIEVIVHTDSGITAEAVETLDDITPPEKTGYNFCGWYSSPELSGEPVTSLPKSGRVSLYPKWEPIIYTVNFDSRGGNTVAPLAGIYGTPLAAPEAPEKTGHAFAGWYEDEALTAPYIFDKFEPRNITLFAKWEIIAVTISFRGESGEDYGKKVLDYGDALGNLPAPEKAGYTLAGWKTSGGITVSGEDTALKNLTLYPVWVPETNTLILDGNGGQGQTVVLSVKTGEEITLPQNEYVREGYTFSGWAMDIDGEAAFADCGKCVAGADKVCRLYAVWVPVNTIRVIEAEVRDIIYGEPLSIAITKNTAGGVVVYGYKKAGDTEFSPVVPSKAGEYEIKISAETDDGETVSAVYAFRISKREITVEAGIPVSRAYNGETTASITPSNYILKNVLPGDDPLFSYGAAALDSPHAGAATKVTLSGLKVDNANYILNADILEIPASVTPKRVVIYAEGKSKVYGETDPDLTYTAEGFIGSDRAVGTLTREAGEGAGSYKISGAFFNPDYEIETIPAALLITPRPISVAAADASKIYGDLDPVLTYTVAGGIDGNLPFGETLTGNLARVSGEDTGSYSILIGSLSVPDNKNYSLTFTGGSFSVLPAEARIITVNIPKTYYYLGFPQSISGAEAEGGGRITYINNSFTSAGEHEIIIFAEGTRNFKSGSLIFTVTVLPAVLTATYAGESIVYGDTPALTVSVSGFLGSDSEAVLKTRPQVLAEKLGAGRYGLTPSGGEADNYIFSYEAGTLDISPRPITVTIDSHTKIFGQPDPELTYTRGEFVHSEDAFSGGIYREEGEAVGKYAIYSTLGNPNYSLTVTEGELEILPNRITAVQSAGGTLTPADLNETDIVYGESVSFTAVPDAGYSVISIIIDGTEIPAEAARGKEYEYIFESVISSATIEAVFARNENRLIFDGNGGTGGDMTAMIMLTGETDALPHNGFTKEGYIFIGWSDSREGAAVYADGGDYTMGAGDEYILYALWAGIVKGEAGGAGLNAEVAGAEITFTGELDPDIPAANLGGGFWVRADIVFPAGVPLSEAMVSGDDRFVFISSEGNRLAAYLSIGGEDLGRRFAIEIKWNDIAEPTEFGVTIGETLTFAVLTLTGITAELSDGSISRDAESRSVTLPHGAEVVKIVAEFNRNIALKYENGLFGFGGKNLYEAEISGNTAEFIMNFSGGEGEYPFRGYTSGGEEEDYLITDETGVLALSEAVLFILTVSPPAVSAPLTVTNIQASITNSYKTQTYQNGTLTISAKARVAVITITFSEYIILGAGYTRAAFMSDMNMIDISEIQATDNTLTAIFEAAVLFPAETYRLCFLNSRNQIINVPLTAETSGQAISGTTLITVYSA